MEKDTQGILLAERIVRLERILVDQEITLPSSDSTFLRSIIFDDIMGKKTDIPIDLVKRVRAEFPALVQDVRQGMINDKIIAPPPKPNLKKNYQ